MERTDLPDQLSVFKQLANYRKLKEYKKELDAIDEYLSAIARRNKSKQDEWIKEHPQAAKAGRAILRKLGDTGSGFGMEEVVARLLKRKQVVEQKLTGRKPARPRVKKAAMPAKKKAAIPAKKKAEELPTRKKAREQEKKAKEQEKKEKERQDRKRVIQEKAERRKREKAERVAAAAAKKKAAEIARVVAKQEREKAAAAKKAYPSLYVISLRYEVSLERIDAAMKLHLAYLDKYYKAGNFLVSGRRSPRTGGIIIAKGKTRSAIGKIVAQDPFIKKKLATADIIEFWASRSTKDFQRLL